MTGKDLITVAQAVVQWPVSDLSHILQACDPGKPLSADDTRRIDLKILRHGSSIAPLRRRLTMLPADGDFHHLLLCGHRGSGKSTELRTLQQWADQQGFLAVWTEVDQRYGMVDLDYTDLYLLAAVLVEHAMAEFGCPLPAEKIKTVVEWFKDRIVEDTDERKSELGVEAGAQIGGKLPFSLGSLFAKLTASYKGTTTHAAKTRDTLRRYPNELIDLTSDLLTTANEILRQNGRSHGLLILFDNLDRYDPVNIDAILVRGSQQMRRLACHALFTFPISLAYKPITGRVGAEYAHQVTLPMLALRESEMPWADTVAASKFDAEAIKMLREAISKRIVIQSLFEHPEDVDLLIKMSGGAMRDLIQLVANASNYAEEGEVRISTAAVHSAINDLRAVYMRFLTTSPHDYLCLAAIARRKSIATEKDDYSAEVNRLLFNGCLLEYIEDGQPWLDVHPVLIETKEFRNACTTHDNKTP